MHDLYEYTVLVVACGGCGRVETRAVERRDLAAPPGATRLAGALVADGWVLGTTTIAGEGRGRDYCPECAARRGGYRRG